MMSGTPPDSWIAAAGDRSHDQEGFLAGGDRFGQG